MALNSKSSEFRISKQLVLVNSLSSVLTRFLNATVLLWVFQYLIKRIPAEEFAVYPVVSAVMVVAPLFFLVFSGGISRYMVAAHVKGCNDEVTRIVSTILPLLALASMLFSGVGLIFAYHIDDILNIPVGMVDEARLMIILLVASYSTRMVFLPCEAGFHVRQRFVELNLLSVGQELLKVSVLLFLLFGFGPKVLWVVVATVVAELSMIAAMAFRSIHLLPSLRFRRHMFDRGRARELMSFGIWSTLGHLSAMMQTNAAVVILNLLATAIDVTSFYVGSTLYGQINRTIQLGMSPLQPVLTAMHSNNDQRKLASTAMRGGRYACWLSLAVAAPLAIYSHEVTLLYVGEEYLSASWVILLLMAIQVVARPTACMGMIAIAKAKVRGYYLASFLVMSVSVLGMIWSARAGHGAVGVTLVLCTTIFFGYVIYYWPFFLKLIKVSVGEFLRQVVLPGTLPALAGSVMWMLLKARVTIDSWGTLLMCSLAGGIVYLITLFGACLTESDKADLKRVLRRLMGN